MLADAHAIVVELTSIARLPLGGPNPTVGAANTAPSGSP